MPLPKPKTGETAKKFTSRFMGDPGARKEFPKEGQRYKVALQRWNDRTKVQKFLDYTAEVIRILKRRRDKYDKIAGKLADIMITVWDQNAKDSIADAIRQIKRTGPYKGTLMVKEEVDRVIDTLGTRLGVDIVGEMNSPTFQMIEDIYVNEFQTIAGTAASFSLVDERSMDWIRKNTMYWVGQHYDEHLSEGIAKIGEAVLKDGMDRATAAAFFQKNLGKTFKRSRVYWDLLSNHVVNRTREFGRVGAYQTAKIKYLKIRAIMDHRTSLICQELNGKIIPVSHAIKTRDAIINAKDPESVKEISPWHSDKEVRQKYIGMNPKDYPDHFGLPPYHGRCRTRTTRGTKEDWTKQQERYREAKAERGKKPKGKKDADRRLDNYLDSNDNRTEAKRLFQEKYGKAFRGIQFAGIKAADMATVLNAADMTLGRYNTKVGGIGWQRGRSKSLGMYTRFGVASDPANLPGLPFSWDTAALQKTFTMNHAKQKDEYIRMFSIIRKNQIERIEKTLKGMKEQGLSAYSIDSVTRELKIWKLSKRHNTFEAVDNALENVALHEFHHTIENRHQLTQTWANNLVDQYGRDAEFNKHGSKHSDFYKVSAYATTNWHELFAETGAAIMGGLQVPTRLKKAYDLTMKTIRSE